MCNCRYFHRITNIETGTAAVNLTITNPTDIGNLDGFILSRNKCLQPSVTGAPLPVTVTVNGAAVPLLNKYGLQIQSDNLPYYACGSYVSVSPAGAPLTAPYVILFDTPKCRCNA